MLPTTPAIKSSTHFEPVLSALAARSFFKLICGGSFSDIARLKNLITAYAACVDMIDISASLPVVEAAVDALSHFENPPLLMVSFPLDADPHFRKIALSASDCIDCGACLPVCPTGVFTLPEASHLAVDTPACYGCGRCVPICPTDALALDPFSVMPDLTHVLAMTEVAAVEIHTTHADPMMIDALYAEIGPWLENKLISICLRPQVHPLAQSVQFINALKARTPFPLIVQVDGEPMSGNDDPEASRPALDAARDFAPYLAPDCFLTISGGINLQTASYLQDSAYSAIGGVGMGTTARQAVWDHLSRSAEAARVASLVAAPFRQGKSSDIIATEASGLPFQIEVGEQIAVVS